MNKIPFDITCWYLNSRRAIELTGLNSTSNSFQEIARLQKLKLLSEQKNAIIAYMCSNEIEPLDKLLSEKRLEVGKFFTHNTNFFFKGLSAVQNALNKNKLTPLASGYAKLDHWQNDSRLTFNFHHEHLTSNSSWSELVGQKRMFMFGLVQEFKENEITAIPYIIGNFISNGSVKPVGNFFGNYCEVHIDRIDNFSSVINYNPRRTKDSLEDLRKIPEKDVKQAFAEIINEPHIPKDWGGESSDLFSSFVSIDGKRISSAFAFKGPAKFRPMTMAELGKNGDQISRLYDEPADLLILQHCNEITNPVRKNMRAYAQQVGNTRICCIIDGHDTLRILEAYEKCGLKKKE